MDSPPPSKKKLNPGVATDCRSDNATNTTNKRYYTRPMEAPLKRIKVYRFMYLFF
jgi:hypothetical protein